MLSVSVRIGLCAVLLVHACAVMAGTVHLRNGSVIKGEIERLEDARLSVTTDFAGELKIDMEAVQGLTTEEPVVLTLENGDEIRGHLAYEPGGEQRLAESALGATTLPLERLRAVRLPGTPSPAEEKLAAMRERRDNLWSGRLLFGLSGSSGNTESRDINFGAKAQRDAEDDRLYLDLYVDRSRQDGEQTTDETSGSVRLERDFSERFFAFGQTEIERDEFENIDFRSTTTIGPGYYFLMQEDHELKGRLGLGYEYVQPETDDGKVSEAVLTLGYDYMIRVVDGFRFTHELTLLPQVSNQPGENFRVDSNLGLEVALGEATGWSVLAQYRHEYNNNPEPGVEELDTSYLLNLVRQFE